jgi:hypothetical protein
LGVFNNNSGATLAGAGVYAGNLVNDGTFSPGNSPGVFTINGTFTNNGTLRIEIGGNDGAGAPAGHDKLQINGDAILGGTVQIVVINGFTPLDMNTYNFVNVSGSVTNAFGSTNAPAGWIIDYLGANVNTTFVQVLPVTLISLAGKRLNANDVLISWATASETNNHGIDVEMSDDNKNFIKMGFVSGKGNSTAIMNYEFQMTNSKSAYYRLKQIDFDGKMAYSHSVFVAGAEKIATTFNVYPNPSKGLLNVHLTNPSHELVSYTVVNALGQVVVSGEMNSETSSLDLSTQAAGMYLLKVISNGAVQTKQIVINR